MGFCSSFSQISFLLFSILYLSFSSTGIYNGYDVGVLNGLISTTDANGNDVSIGGGSTDISRKERAYSLVLDQTISNLCYTGTPPLGWIEECHTNVMYLLVHTWCDSSPLVSGTMELKFYESDSWNFLDATLVNAVTYQIFERDDFYPGITPVCDGAWKPTPPGGYFGAQYGEYGSASIFIAPHDISGGNLMTFGANKYIFVTVKLSPETNKEKMAMFLDNKDDRVVLFDFFRSILLLTYQKEGIKVFKKEISFTKLLDIKISIVKFLTCGVFEKNEILIHVIIGLSVENIDVSGVCEGYMKKHSIDYDDKLFVKQLYSYFYGQLGRFPLENEKRVLLKYLCKSRTATEVFPEATNVIHSTLLQSNASNAVKELGIQFLVHALSGGFSNENNFDKIKNMFVALVDYFHNINHGDGFEINKQKEKVYPIIGNFAKLFPKLLHLIDPFLLIKTFFESLEVENSYIRVSIQQGLSTLTVGLRSIMNNDMKSSMEDFFGKIIENQNENPNSVYPVIHCCNNLFPFSHIQSRFFNLLSIGHQSLKVKEEAKRGVNFKAFSTHKRYELKNVKEEFPDFEDFMSFTSRFLSKNRMNDLSLMGTIMFARQCFGESAKRKKLTMQNFVLMLSGKKNNSVEAYLDCIFMSFSGNPHADLLLEASRSILDLLSIEVIIFSNMLKQKLSVVKLYMFNGEKVARKNMGKIYAVLFLHLSKEEKEKEFNWIKSNLSDKKTERVIHGSILAIGFIASFMFRKEGKLSPKIKQSISNLVPYMNHHKESIPEGVVEAFGYFGLNDGLLTFSQDIDLKSGKKRRKKIDVHSIVQMLISKLNETESSKLQEKIVNCLGEICAGTFKENIVNEISEELLSFKKSKQVEKLFAIGEAFSCIIGETSLFNKDKFLTIFGVRKENDSIIKKRNEFSKRLLKKIITEGVLSPAMIVRQSASIWLLSIVMYCKSNNFLKQFTHDLQEAFSLLITDLNEITSSVATKGLTFVYELSDNNNKKDLVNSLIANFQGKNTYKGQLLLFSSIEEDQKEKEKQKEKMGDNKDKKEDDNKQKKKEKKKKKTFPKTYKELCSIAEDVGDPTLIYKFMNISNQNKVWNSKRAAAFSTVDIIKSHNKFDEMKKILPKILPKLFRYQFDPIPEVNKAMTDMWNSLVESTPKAIDKYLQAILEDIDSNLLHKLWRTRESCCNGLMLVFSYGRKFYEVEKSLTSIVLKLFKLMDDIKLSVRTQASKALQKLGKFMVKSCDKKYSKKESVEKAIFVIAPFLLKTGIKFHYTPIKYFSILQISKICTVCGDSIRPYVCDIIETLLRNMSKLENQDVNYLLQHTDKLGVSKEEINDIRLKMANKSPIAETIDICCRYIDKSNLERMIAMLIEMLQTSVGMTTRLNTIKVITNIAKFNRKDLRKKQTTKLLGCIFQNLKDSEIAASEKKSFAISVVYLLNSAGSKRKRAVIAEIIELYYKRQEFELVCIIIDEMAKKAGETFALFQRELNPIIFLGQFNENEKIREKWKRSWEENLLQSSVSTIKKYEKEISEQCLVLLDDRKWKMKKHGCDGLIEIAKQLKTDIDGEIKMKILLKLIESVSRTVYWDGKERLVYGIAEIIHKSYQDKDTDTFKPVYLKSTQVLLSQSKKKKKTYKLESLIALNKLLSVSFVSSLIDVEFYEKAKKELEEIVEKMKKEKKSNFIGNDNMDLDDIKEFLPIESKIKIEIIELFSRLFPNEYNEKAYSFFVDKYLKNLMGYQLTMLERIRMLDSFVIYLGQLEKINDEKSQFLKKEHFELLNQILLYNMNIDKVNLRIRGRAVVVYNVFIEFLKKKEMAKILKVSDIESFLMKEKDEKVLEELEKIKDVLIPFQTTQNIFSIDLD